jgi:hypothetical protein
MPSPTRARKRKDTGPAWTAPDEKATLLGFLDYLRNAIADKVADVPEPQVRTPGVPSGMNNRTAERSAGHAAGRRTYCASRCARAAGCT